MKLEQSDSGKNSPNSCQDRDSNDGNIHPMKSLPCPCGQRFIESQDFVEHARTCPLFAMTASSFAEAARAVTSVNANKPDIDVEGQFNHKGALSNSHDGEEKEIPHPFTIGRGALDLTNRSLSMMENEPSFGISNVGLNETQYTCLQCNATYASQSTLMKHFDKDHNVRGSFTCDCNATFDNLSTLLSHQMSCPAKSETKMKTNNLSCSMCGQGGFQYPAELLGHMNSCHMLGNNNSTVFSLPSSFPGNFDSKIPHPSVLRRGASFLQSGSGILPHLIPNLMNNSANPLNNPVSNILNKPNKPVTPEIRQGNNRNNKMNENRDNSANSNDLSRPFRCDHCVKSFKSKALLDQHMHIHFPPKYTCRYCSKKYRWPPVFYHHQRTCKKRSQPAITTASTSIMNDNNNRILNAKSNMPPHSSYEFGSSRQSGLDQHSMMCNDLKFGRGNKPPYLSYLNGNSFPPNTCNMTANGKQRPINSSSMGSPTISNPTNANNLTSSSASDLSMLGNKAPNFMAMMAAASMGMRFPWVPPLGLNNMNGSTNSTTANAEPLQKSTPFNPSPNSSPFNWKTNLPYRQNENGSNPNISSLTKCLCGSKFDDFTSYFTHISTCKHFAKSTNTSSNFTSPFNYIQNLLESKMQEKGNKIDVENENDKQTLNTTASALASMVASMNSTFSKQEFNISNMFSCMQNSMSNIGSKRPYSPAHNEDDETSSSASPKIRMDSKNISSNLLSEMANVLVSATNCENKRLSCDSVNQNMTSSSSSCGEPSSKSPDATLNQLHDRKSIGDNSDNLDTTGSHPSSPASETVCKICCKEFSNRLALKQHFDGKHGSEYRYKCPGCGKSYRWGASYYYHRKSCQAVKELGINGDEEDINNTNYDYITKVSSHITDGLRSYDEQNMELMYKGHMLSPNDINKTGNVDNIESSSDPEIDRSPIPYDDKDEDDVDESIPRPEKIPRSNSSIAHGSRSRSVLCSPTNPISALGDMLVE